MGSSSRNHARRQAEPKSKFLSFEQNEQDPVGVGTRAIRAGGWLMGLQIVSRVLMGLQRIILAHLLVPEDFGRMGVALLVIGGGEAVTTPGMDAALLQKRLNMRDYLNTLWTYGLLRSLVVAGVFAGLAGYLAGILRSPTSARIIQVVALGIVLRGIINPGLLEYRRDLKFRPKFIISVSASLAGMVFSVGWALVTRNVWALVAGVLATTLVEIVLSYVLHPFRPRLEWSISKAGKMFGFGVWLWLSSILLFLVTQGDDVVVARWIGPTFLAYYQMAYWLANLPATHLANFTAQIAFPAYARIQDDPARLSKAYMNTLLVIMTLAVFFSVTVGCLARPLTLVVFGAKWESMVGALGVFCLAGLFRCVAATAGPLIMATGQPRVDTIGQVVRLVVLAGSIFPCIHRWGLTGAAISVTMSTLAHLLVVGYSVKRILGEATTRVWRAILPALLSGCVLVGAYFWVSRWSAIVSWPGLTLAVAGGCAVYVAVLFLCDRILGCDTWPLLKRFLEDIRP